MSKSEEKISADRKRFGMGGHQGPMQSDEWLTPKHVLDALGPFDLDPCASIVRPWPTAKQHYTVEDDGLSRSWNSASKPDHINRVWLNPPYGRFTSVWLERLAQHGRGTALVFARTETAAWQDSVWNRASSVMFLYGRLCFCNVQGQGFKGAGAPSALISYGNDDAAILRDCGLPGKWLPLDCGRRDPLQLQLTLNSDER